MILLFYSHFHSCSNHTGFLENTKFMFLTQGFFLCAVLFSVDSLTTCFLISFMSFPECHHLSGTSPVTIFKNIHSYTHTYILSVPFLCFISLHSTYCHSAIICFTFLSATPVRTELFMFVYCCIPEY